MNVAASLPTEPQTKPVPAEKKPYSAPCLTTHGTVAELTLGPKSGSLPDGESSGSHDTALF